MNQRAFGRKSSSQTASALADTPVQRIGAPERKLQAWPAEARTPPPISLDANSDASPEAGKSVDEELAEWKRSRRLVIPWRPVSLMATLSFGIASLVLPDAVDEPIEWLLYALTAASMVTTVAAWWKKLTHVV